MDTYVIVYLTVLPISLTNINSWHLPTDKIENLLNTARRISGLTNVKSLSFGAPITQKNILC